MTAAATATTTRIPACRLPAASVPTLNVLPSAVASTSPCKVGRSGVDDLHGVYVELGLPTAMVSTTTAAVPASASVPPVAAMLVLYDLDGYRDGQWHGQKLGRQDLRQDGQLGNLLELLLVVQVVTGARVFHEEREQNHESQKQGTARR